MTLHDAPNLNYLWCGLLVEELVRQGVAGFVISPGSRNAPLTVSVARNENARYWMHYDERGAAFFALGLAKATGKPAVLICTSGSAVANYWPAVVEAAMDRVPLILLTADRPPELVDCGANQAIDQCQLFGNYARWYTALPCPTESCSPAFVLTSADQAWHRSQHPLAGPVHVNVPLREPLDPRSDDTTAEHVLAPLGDWEVSGAPFTCFGGAEVRLSRATGTQVLDDVTTATRGVLIVGRLNSIADRDAVRDLAATLGWMVYADITTGLYGPDAPENLMAEGDAAERILEAGWPPDCVLHIGGSFTSKLLLTALQEGPLPYIHVVDHDQRIDPNHQVSHRITMGVASFCQWLLANVDGGGDERPAALSAAPTPPPKLTEQAIAQVLGTIVPEGSLLFAGSSMPIRLVERYCRPRQRGVRIAANRGASGIDGNVATALGMAVAGTQPTTLLVGDLTALHDLNSLALLKEVGAPVVMVVINNDGGGIFHHLPIAASGEACFERCFGTPHGLNFEGAAQMFGVAYVAPENPADFVVAYEGALETGGATIIEVCTNRYESGQALRAVDLPDDDSLPGDLMAPQALRPKTLAGSSDKPPLLLIHGFMGDMSDWEGLAQALGETHHVLGVNLPGHGPGWEDFPVDYYDMGNCAAALNGFLDEMGIGPCALIGYSMGGRFAFYLAALFPERYTRVILESASPGLDTDEKRHARQAQDSALSARLSVMDPWSGAYRDFLEEWYSLPLFESLGAYPDTRAQLIERRLANNTPQWLAASLDAFGTGSQPNLWPYLGELRTPTLLLVGEKDRKYRIVAEDMCAACPTMAVIEFADCGHIVHLENPDELLTAVRGFLALS